MEGFGALAGLLGCVAAAALAILHDFLAAGAVLLVSLVCFGAERLLK
jgi:hypothetical protein